MLTVRTWTGREAQLLRIALRLSQRGFAAYLGVSERIVATWEKRGPTITPRSEFQAVLDTALTSAAAEAQTRFQQATKEEQASDLDSTSARAVDLRSGLPFAGHHPLAEELGVSLVDAEQIELLAVDLTAWDHARGGSLARIAAVAQARWATELLDLPAPRPVHQALARAAAQLCLAAGFMAFDAERHTEARSVFASAIDCAREAKDPRLEAKALSHQARQAIWCGDYDRALGLLDAAMELPGLSGRERAMLHSARARAFAKLDWAPETLAAVEAADDAFASHRDDDTPVWMTYYDAAQHHGDTGHALFDLAVRGREQDEARVRLRAAADGHDSGHARSQAFSQAKLAALHFVVGEPEQGFELAMPAARQIIALRSARAFDTLSEMARFALPYRSVEGADQLSMLIREEMSVDRAGQGDR